jgi:hypothetical protein
MKRFTLIVALVALALLLGCTAARNSTETPTCEENWVCDGWTTCSNGLQTRICTDSNSCETTLNQPVTSQSCTKETAPANEESLVEIKTYEIIPQGIQVQMAWRPEINKIGDDFYYAFNKGDKERGGFALVVLDQNFRQKKAVNLFSGEDKNYFPTDLRTAKDDKGNFWYAFETAKINGAQEIIENCRKQNNCEINRDNVALYNGTDLDKTKTPFVSGCVVMPAIIAQFGEKCYTDKPLSDDPAPFFYQKKHYVLTRYAMSPRIVIREFNDNLDVVNQYDFNLPLQPSTAADTVAEIEGKLYILASVGKGTPNSPDSSSAIYAFELAPDFSSVTNTIKLVNYPGEMDMRVTSARYEDGKLFFSYQNNKQGSFGIYLEAFDARNNFSSISRVKVTDQLVQDGHNSVEISGNKIYVAYVNANENLAIAEFELKQ